VLAATPCGGPLCAPGRAAHNSRKPATGNAHRWKGKHLRVTQGYHRGAPGAMVMPPGVSGAFDLSSNWPRLAPKLVAGLFFAPRLPGLIQCEHRKWQIGPSEHSQAAHKAAAPTQSRRIRLRYY
jgi:hypothetical protein